MGPRNEGRIKKDYKQLLLLMNRPYLSVSECGHVAVSCEYGISDRLYKRQEFIG